MFIDRSWMKANRLSKECEDEVIQFLEFRGKNNSGNNGVFYYPCKKKPKYAKISKERYIKSFRL